MGDIWPALLLALTHGCRMAQCRDLENHHHEKLLEIAINTLEKILKGEMDEDLPDDVRAVSKDGRTGAQQPGQGPEVARLSVTSSRRSVSSPEGDSNYNTGPPPSLMSGSAPHCPGSYQGR